MFDLEKFEIIDISHIVIPGENVDRPFAIQKALLDNLTYRYDILKPIHYLMCTRFKL